MKLLNPDGPSSEDNSENKQKTNQEQPPPPPGRPVIRHAHPLPSPSGEATAAEEQGASSNPLRKIHPPSGPVRSSGQGIPARSRLTSAPPSSPGARLRAVEEAGKKAKPARLPLRYRLHPDRQKTRYAFWDITGILSLVANAVLLGVIILLGIQIVTLRKALSSGLMRGLYTSFVDMDNASINTTIAVNAQIPLNFNLPVQQNTAVSLTQSAVIPGAHVVIKTALFNINAPADVTLPAGTVLPIALNLQIPVQANIPISLQVPVSIPLSSTGLHDPFINLQTAIRPYYCMLEPNAEYPQGKFICQETNASTTQPGVP